MGYFNFYIIKKILFYFKKKLPFIIAFIISFILLFCFLNNNSFASSPSAVFDIERQLRDNQINEQNTFAIHCVQPFINNTEYWQNCLLPIFEDIDSRDRSFTIIHTIQNNKLVFNVYVYDLSNSTTYTTTTTGIDGIVYNVLGREWSNSANVYRVEFDYTNNTGTMSLQQNRTFTVQDCVAKTKSEFLLHFIKGIYEGNISLLFQDISSYLSNIQSVNNDILLELQTLSNTLTSLPSQFPDNTSQISSISDKISDLLSDNEEIINQNSEMIEQQEQINQNLENVSNEISDLKDTISDDTVESSAEDLPSIDVSDPTATGIDNIFQSIYNAFCVGEAQDIVFPIPYTDKNITLSPYYVRDMLQANGAGWIYTFIQIFWSYFIGRFIITDISKKINKIKSGDIENIENSNIKEEML